jgi:xylose dehydrogenase (NAD/NADP)
MPKRDTPARLGIDEHDLGRLGGRIDSRDEPGACFRLGRNSRVTVAAHAAHGRGAGASRFVDQYDKPVGYHPRRDDRRAANRPRERLVTVLRWGILGPGRITTRMVDAVGRCERGEVTAVGSRDAGRAAAYCAQHGIAHAFGSYEALVDAPDVDVIYIGTPNHLHVPWTIRALEAGKHVLCEKPIAMAAHEVDAIADACRRTGRIAVEGFMYLHHPQILRTLELAGSGALGPLELINGTFSFLLTDETDVRVDPTMGAGSLWDVGCYPVSMARRIAGREPDQVNAWARFDERGVDRTFLGQLHFPGGPFAQFDSGFAAPHRERIEVVGRDATLVLDHPFLPPPYGAPASLTMWRDDEATPIEVPPADQVLAEVEDLTAAILDGTPPRVDLAFSRGNIATLFDLDRAARANGEVR